MKRNLVFGGALYILFFAASPVLATITFNLENPAGGAVSGISVISGWAFCDSGGEVTVKLRVDGVIAQDAGEDVVIPCCGNRQDVVEVHPVAPLNSSFSLLFNYGELSFGPHIIGVEISAPDEESVIVDRSVKVVKAGATSFATTYDLTEATASIEGNRIVVTDLGITSASGTRTDNVDIELNPSSQSPVFADASSNMVVVFFTANLNQDQEIPTPTPTSASGSATLTLNVDNTLAYNVTTADVENPLLLPPDGDPSSAAHIHMAPAGETGDIILFLELTEGSTTEWSGTTEPLTQEQLEALLNAGLYINVHTEQNSAGEIRGQIVATQTEVSCNDSSRIIFAGRGIGGGMGETCTQFADDQASCEMAWQLTGQTGAPVSCFFGTNEMGAGPGCFGCGPGNEAAGICTNTCS